MPWCYREPDPDRHGAINGTGNALANVITGNSGNNILAGLGGADTVDWRRGNGYGDLYCFGRRRERQPDDRLGRGGDAEGDTLATIENLTGSNLNDTLEGNGGNNVLDGGLGIDTLSLRACACRCDGQPGFDQGAEHHWCRNRHAERALKT